MNRWCMAVALLMIGVGTATAAHEAPVRSVEWTGDVALQTDPTSSFWRGALPVFAELDSYGKPMSAYRTEIRSRWTKNDIYFLFVCPYEELHLKPSPDPLHETNQLWNWDVAEVFISA